MMEVRRAPSFSLLIPRVLMSKDDPFAANCKENYLMNFSKHKELLQTIIVFNKDKVF